ncbi:hypothetical protein CYMTET_14510 [Cymbomonas tetramitiformis]|uniref:peptidylprolyl isomerase n=1 Tax=Cymbomonas tetramitiformis TaxID=36881 RepID=A0AAE0LA36_9CHLO|nr:hypothetical protein CYMTET_14510 [Cymbomonas tetramitiformis]
MRQSTKRTQQSDINSSVEKRKLLRYAPILCTTCAASLLIAQSSNARTRPVRYYRGERLKKELEDDPTLQFAKENALGLFEELDLDDDGEISEDEIMDFFASGDELTSAAKEYQVPLEFIACLLDFADANGDGSITRTEFTNFMLEKERFLVGAFSQADSDGSGELDINEFEEALANIKIPEGRQMKKLTQRAVRELTAKTDADGDGVISYFEFRQAFLTVTRKDMENVNPYWAEWIFGTGASHSDVAAEHRGEPGLLWWVTPRGPSSILV